MFVHFARHFTSTRVATRIVDVRCDKSATEFHFQLRRSAIGEGTAHYGIGTDGARLAAKERSQRQLVDRLSTGTEPVPCPTCHWINEDLVEAYRWGRHGYPILIAIVLGLAGLVFSFTAAWFFSNGNAIDRADATFFLLYVPACIVGAVIFVCLLQLWRMNCFRPNQTYPDPPRLPLGVPPALIRDRATGEYALATAVLPNACIEASPSSHYFAFHVGQHQMPSVCCLCPADANPNCKELHKSQEMEIAFPLCSACHRSLSRKRFGLSLLNTVLSNAALATLAINLHWCPASEVWMFGLLSVPITMILSSMAAAVAIQPVRIRQADATRGILHLKFQNPRYSSLIIDTSNEPPLAANTEIVHFNGIIDQQIEATISGERIIDVRCDKCDCNYFYELSRTGEAVASTIQQEESEMRMAAINDAQAALKHRLTTETEPVPCPQCHWINDRMARDYQQRLYRGCETLAVCLAIVVISISFFIGWCIKAGPPADHGVLPILFIYGPVSMVLFTILVLTISAWLRHRSNPNWRYPMPPELPAEVPPALFLDPVSGKYYRAPRS